jgi:hypothetical protein
MNYRNETTGDAIMAKTPTHVLRLMERQELILRHVDEVLRVKATVPVESQADHVREKSADYYVGLADGANTMLEEAMHRAGCYAGFMYVSESKGQSYCIVRSEVRPDHPEFAEWRRVYFTHR